MGNGFSPVHQSEPHRRGFRDEIARWMNINYVIDSL